MKQLVLVVLLSLLAGCGDYRLDLQGRAEIETTLQAITQEISDCKSIGKTYKLTMWEVVLRSQEYSLAHRVICIKDEKKP